jgi:hypothetical protein
MLLGHLLFFEKMAKIFHNKKNTDDERNRINA